MKRNLLIIKKFVTILILAFTLILMGSLYNTLAKHEKMETVAIGSVYMNHFPEPMPNIVINPMINYPLMR